MTAPINKPITQEQLNRFKAYKEKNSEWGHLHLVLGNLNVQDKHVEFCGEMAAKHSDEEGCYLVDVLKNMSKSQRHKLVRQCADVDKFWHGIPAETTLAKAVMQ